MYISMRVENGVKIWGTDLNRYTQRVYMSLDAFRRLQAYIIENPKRLPNGYEPNIPDLVSVRTTNIKGETVFYLRSFFSGEVAKRINEVLEDEKLNIEPTVIEIQ